MVSVCPDCGLVNACVCRDEELRSVYNAGYAKAKQEQATWAGKLLSLYEHGNDKEFLAELNRMAGKGGSHG